MLSDVSVSLLASKSGTIGERSEQLCSTADQTLLERFLQGENAALVELFDRHNRRLLVYAQKILGDADGARDLVQEVWVRVLKLRGRSRRVDNPVGFLLRMTRNLCLTALTRRRSLVRLDDLREADRPRHEQASDRDESIVAALERLPFEYREVLVLGVYCGYSTDEIARMLKRTTAAIWKRASRARALLRSEVLKQERIRREDSR
jgi:RNA polymerase sigma-70 factor (ECF subfamily)